ncbi:hypothetical protein ACS0TY_008164 [Phlomoides rotata]
MIKINFDAAVRTGVGVTIGGVARDWKGLACWCYAEKPNLEDDVNVAEAYAAYRGLQLAKEMGLTQVILETDSQRLYYAVANPKTNFSVFGELVDEIIALCKGFVIFRISWIRRIGNSVAHSLASFAYIIEDPFFSTTVPNCCFSALEADFVA